MEFLPREDFRCRIEEVCASHVVVGDMNLGIPAAECQLSTELGNGQGSRAGFELQFVRNGICAIVDGMAHHIKRRSRFSANDWGDR